MAGKNKQESLIRSIWLPLIPLALVSAACAVPLLFTHAPALAFALQRGFALVCHQRPERSFVLFGGSVAVCVRCFGLYVGAAAGLLVRALRQLAWQFFISAGAVNALDWLTELAGLHGNWTLIRFVLGVILGIAATALVRSSLWEIAHHSESAS